MNVKVQVEEQPSWRRILSIEVPAEDVAREYSKVAQRVARTVRLPGFRKGKVPVTVVMKSFKSELDREFLETVVPKAFGHALDETGLDPVTEPKFEELSFGDERPLSFKADFEMRPEIDLNGLTGIKGTREVPAVDDEQVGRVLEDFRRGRAELEEVERGAIDGDVLLVDYEALDAEGEPIPERKVTEYVLEMGAGRVVPEFEEALKGAEPRATRVAEVPYPEDYQDEVLAGTTARYRITVRTVQEKRFPELTDELVKEHTDLQSLEELKGKVREELELQAGRAATEQLEHALLESVVDSHPFDSPVSLVDGLLEDFVRQRRQEAAYQGEDPEAVDADQLKETHREGADRQVRRMLLLDAIARKQELDATEPEVRERVLRMAQMRGVPPKKLIEDLGGDRLIRRLSREIRDKKVLAFLVENAEITEKTVPVPAAPTEA